MWKMVFIKKYIDIMIIYFIEILVLQLLAINLVPTAFSAFKMAVRFNCGQTPKVFFVLFSRI